MPGRTSLSIAFLATICCQVPIHMISFICLHVKPGRVNGTLPGSLFSDANLTNLGTAYLAILFAFLVAITQLIEMVIFCFMERKGYVSYSVVFHHACCLVGAALSTTAVTHITVYLHTKEAKQSGVTQEYVFIVACGFSYVGIILQATSTVLFSMLSHKGLKERKDIKKPILIIQKSKYAKYFDKGGDGEAKGEEDDDSASQKPKGKKVAAAEDESVFEKKPKTKRGKAKGGVEEDDEAPKLIPSASKIGQKPKMIPSSTQLGATPTGSATALKPTAKAKAKAAAKEKESNPPTETEKKSQKPEDEENAYEVFSAHK